MTCYLKYINILFIIMVIQLFSTGCGKQKMNEYITYEGNVYYKSGRAAANVVVILYACAGGSGDKQHQCTGKKFIVKRTTTDEDGHFYIREKASRIDVYFVTIDKYYSNSNGVSAKTLAEDRFSNVHLSY